jgi:hypothetical protein
MRESLSKLTSELAGSGRAWFNAEAALARAYLAGDANRLGTLLLLSVFGIFASSAGATLLLAYGVALLAPHVGGIANAAGIMGIVLCLLAGLAVWMILRILRTQLGVRTLVKRWASMLSQGPGDLR